MSKIRPWTNQFPRLHPVSLLLVFLTVIFIFSGCKGHSNSPLLPVHAPAVPLGITAAAGDHSVSLAWSRVDSAKSYVIYRSVISGVTGTRILSSRNLSFIDTGISDGDTYFYSVSAVNSAGEGDISGQVSATPGSFISSPTVTVAVIARYQDKEYDVKGVTGNRPYKAIRYATIELLDGDGLPLGVASTTGSDGSYIISVPTSTVSPLSVRVLAEAVPPGSGVPIQTRNLLDKLYAARSNDFIPSGPVNVTLSVSALSIGGVFNILDVFTNGFEFIKSFAPYPAVALTGYWERGNRYGTYYSSGGIYILNVYWDGDEYDDDVLYHEFAHFAADYFSRDDSPGGAHGITDNDLDMRLTWSEGWAGSFPGAVKMWLPSELRSSVNAPLTQYVDTTRYGVGVSIDMGDPDGAYGHYYRYATSEIAVAKILLDLDKNFGMQTVWNVFTDFRANPPSQPVNIELFWDRWSLLYPQFPAGSIFAIRHIYYSADPYETDDSFILAQAVDQPAHYLYGAADADYVAFTVTNGYTYTVATSSLRNGADTMITVYKGDQTSVISMNDNSNGDSYSGYAVPSNLTPALNDRYGIRHENASDILGSRLIFTATSSGTYYVKIESSPNRPVSAGRYGTYTLTIAQHN